MRSSERHQLKENQFAAATQETISWAFDHRNPLIYGTVIVVVVLLLLVGGFYYQSNREMQASGLLSSALETYQAPLRPAGTPETQGQPSFVTAADRAKAATGKFTEITEKYGHTDSATMASYFLGLAAEDMGDNARAEQFLKSVSDSSNKDIAALAKSALATLYHDTSRDQLAMDVYKQLIEKPTNTVPKALAQIALADIYSTNDPSQARRLYEEVQKDNQDNAIGNVATAKIQGLKQ